MRHSHLDKRSKRYAARQFVSEYTVEPVTVESIQEVSQELNMPNDSMETTGLQSRMMKEPLERCVGTVKFFDKARGYGFCKRQGALDVFFHAKSIERAGITNEITAGDRLEFDLVPVAGKGGKAINLKLLAKEG